MGGLLFDWICTLELTASGRSSRAAAFVVLGLSIGTAIGLAHYVFRVAWVTVVDGFRTGRQLNLTQPVTKLGRGDHLPLPFLGPANKDLDNEHLIIRRMPDGSFCLEDNRSKLGTRLNGRPVTGPMPLKDGDIIRLGTNLVCFNERRRRRSDELEPAAENAALPPAAPPPPASPLPSPPRPPGSAEKAFRRPRGHGRSRRGRRPRRLNGDSVKVVALWIAATCRRFRYCNATGPNRHNPLQS